MFGIFQRLDRLERAFTSLRSEVRANRDVTTVSLARIERAVRAAAGLAAASARNEEAIMADLSEIRTEVEQTGDVVDSAVALITSMADRLDDIADDPAEVRALAEELRASKQELADAVAANTPADPGDGDTEPTEPEPIG